LNFGEADLTGRRRSCSRNGLTLSLSLNSFWSEKQQLIIFFSSCTNKTPATNTTTSCLDLLPVGAQVVVTGGTHINHTAEILGITAKMYHIRLENGTVTKVRHFNVRAMSIAGLTNPSPNANSLRLPSVSPPSTTSFQRATRHWTRERLENGINEALEEIHWQTRIAAEFTERLRLLNLNDESYS
jgi:hypothetical protein